jgi:Fe2+ or Zn2+ uptake regulation protein
MTDKRFEWKKKLSEQGCRLTDARAAVIDVVAQSEIVLKPLEVYELARNSNPRLGLVSVYRTMEKLEELGLIQRVHQSDDCQAFVASKPGHHHLLICTNCGRYEYFQGGHLDPFFETLIDQTAYKISEHWMQVFGLCESCQMQEK